jgi:hypothetical protein
VSRFLSFARLDRVSMLSTGLVAFKGRVHDVLVYISEVISVCAHPTILSFSAAMSVRSVSFKLSV